MKNRDMMKSADWFNQVYGTEFITDTYGVVFGADGYHYSFPDRLFETDGSLIAEAEPGSVIAQYAAMYWCMQIDDFWDERLNQ